MIEENTPILVNILIVDDNSAKLTALAAALESMDIWIVTAHLGSEVLRAGVPRQPKLSTAGARSKRC